MTPDAGSATDLVRPDLLAEVAGRLGALEALPVDAHPPVYDEVHRTLRDRLATLDEV